MGVVTEFTDIKCLGISGLGVNYHVTMVFDPARALGSNEHWAMCPGFLAPMVHIQMDRGTLGVRNGEPAGAPINPSD